MGSNVMSYLRSSWSQAIASTFVHGRHERRPKPRAGGRPRSAMLNRLLHSVISVNIGRLHLVNRHGWLSRKRGHRTMRSETGQDCHANGAG